MKIHLQNAHFATGLHECPTCKRMFSSRATLKRHQLTHTGMLNVIGENEAAFICFAFCDGSQFGKGATGIKIR